VRRFLVSFAFAAYRTVRGLAAAPPRCRHWPSCSAYAEEAVLRHGFRAGAALAIKRLVRCGPWGAAGHDPVPEKVLS
jgi:putative membrane protein insertion efficiency factor